MEFNLKLIVDDSILILLDMANKEFIDKCFNSYNQNENQPYFIYLTIK